MKLPILYKRTRTSAIQYWEIETEGVLNSHEYQVIKTSGQYGTDKPIVNIKTISQGKNLNRSNATTPQQQAESEARSDWKKKKDEGYKSLEDLGISWDEQHEDWVFHKGEHDLDLHKGQHYWRLDQVLEVALPKYNTDASGQTKPMLAQSVKWNKVKYRCLVQPKLDGTRALAVFDGKTVTFLSRTGKKYTTLGHIKKELEEKLTEPVILDGEIFTRELTFQEIVSAVKKQQEQSLQLEFWVYDIVNDQKQLDRELEVRRLTYTISWQHVRALPTSSCDNKDEVMELHMHYVSEGYEGVMIRLLDGTYDQGQRSSNLLKVKEYDTNEFSFFGFELGQRGVEDLIAVCTCEENTFKAKMQGTVAEKQALYANPAPQGTLLTVKHHGYTDDGLPRFPIGVTFRDYE